jgi:hypothetical protein
MYAINCPGCGRSAFEDDYNKTHEKNIFLIYWLLEGAVKDMTMG